MRREDRVVILDMIDEVENVAAFIKGRVREDLDRDRMLLYAVVRALEIMGEAAAKVSVIHARQRHRSHGGPSSRCATA